VTLQPLFQVLVDRLSHLKVTPTKSAAFNSVTLCGARFQIPAAIAEMAEECKNEEERFPDALYRLIWIMLDGDERFITLHISKKDLPQSAKYIELDKHTDSRGEEKSDHLANDKVDV
jgi:hypothetical protein